MITHFNTDFNEKCQLLLTVSKNVTRSFNYEVKKECFVVETMSPRNSLYGLLDVYEKV